VKRGIQAPSSSDHSVQPFFGSVYNTESNLCMSCPTQFTEKSTPTREHLPYRQ